MKKQIIGWKVSTLNPSLASLRYRALFPLLALEPLNVKNKIFIRANYKALVGLDALVIVKSFSLDDYYLALKAVELNVPVIFDLCDNIFIDNYASKRAVAPADIFYLIANIASAISVTTEPLANVVKSKIGENIPIHIIPDGIESKNLLIKANRRLLVPRINEVCNRLFVDNFSKLKRLVKTYLDLIRTASIAGAMKISIKLAVLAVVRCLQAGLQVGNQLSLRVKSWARKPMAGIQDKRQHGSPASDRAVDLSPPVVTEPRTILWFGNHGAAHAAYGMLDLLSIREPLEKIATEMAVELVVVSNNSKKYAKFIAPMSIPSRYFEWNAESMEAHFRNADVAVLPNSLDDFSICKSANRCALALNNEVPVVATSTPALEPLSDCVTLDDFEGGLRCYLSDSRYASLHIKRGKEKIEQCYSQKVIGVLWRDLLSNLFHQHESVDKPVVRDTELVVALQIPQDIALAFPVLEEANRRGLCCSIWTSLAAVKRWPSLLSAIQFSGFHWLVLPDDLKGARTSIFSASTIAVLSASESNLNPHRFTHNLTRLARKAGLYTATMQHGYENIGLSYSDDEHDIKKVNFASSQIFIWGGKETLHPEVSGKTRKKCMPVGCPKPRHVDGMALPIRIGRGAAVVGIFENLHWHRYKDAYRKNFLEGVRQVAACYPEVVFIVKPHNAGMWLTGRYEGDKPNLDNLIIADPETAEWSGVTAPEMFSHLTAVITSPSTVALDSARIEVPTAVVAMGLELDNYSPLHLINDVNGWKEFVGRVLDIGECEQLRAKSRQFVERTLIPGDDAACRIVEKIISQKTNHQLGDSNAA